MATAATDTEREQLAAIPASYFRAVDQYDLPAVLEHFAEDAELAGEESLDDFVRRHLTGDVAVDTTRKQVARDGITWSVRIDGTRASAHARLRDGRITHFGVTAARR